MFDQECIVNRIVEFSRDSEAMDFFITLFIFLGGVFFTFYLLLMNLSWQRLRELRDIKADSETNNSYISDTRFERSIIDKMVGILKGTYWHIGLCLLFAILCFFAGHILQGTTLYVLLLLLIVSYLLCAFRKLIIILKFFYDERKNIVDIKNEFDERNNL